MIITPEKAEAQRFYCVQAHKLMNGHVHPASLNEWPGPSAIAHLLINFCPPAPTPIGWLWGSHGNQQEAASCYTLFCCPWEAGPGYSEAPWYSGKAAIPQASQPACLPACRRLIHSLPSLGSFPLS